MNTGSILRPSFLYTDNFTGEGQRADLMLNLLSEMQVGFDPKPFWSFTGLHHLVNTGQYFLLLGAHLVRYSIL